VRPTVRRLRVGLRRERGTRSPTPRVRFQVHVTPRSRRNEVDVERAAGARRIRVRVTAPPADGKANEAVVAVLAARLGVPRRSVRVAGGATSRVKWIEAEGLAEEDLWRRLEAE